MSSQAKGHLIGLVFIAAVSAIGVYMLLIGFGRFGRSAADAPGWVLIAAGAAFLLAAGSFALSALAGIRYGIKADRHGNLPDEAPYPIRAAQTVLSLGIVAMLATVATWIALNPEAGTSTGRIIAFGAGAAMTWAMFLGFAIWRLRRLKR